jgi:hypothetical protein
MGTCLGILNRVFARMNPPNSCHLLIYLNVLDVEMSDDRDNFKNGNIDKLMKGLSPRNSGTYKGSKNSQVDGFSVIIFLGATDQW